MVSVQETYEVLLDLRKEGVVVPGVGNGLMLQLLKELSRRGWIVQPPEPLVNTRERELPRD